MRAARRCRRAPAMAPSLLAAALVAASLVATGCGSAGHATTSATRRVQTKPSAPTVPPNTVPRVPRSTAPAEAVRVIKAWAGALRRGDLRTAASYFRLPSVLLNGAGANGLQQLIRIRTLVQAEKANATLPCGAKFISATRRGPFVNALFRLTGRPGPGGTDCGSGAGQTARTDFVIRGGKIVDWVRAPDQPGDNHNGGPTPSGGPPPVV